MNVHIISHTHWDREWYLTYEQFRLRLVGLVDRLLDLLESQPDFQYFHLDGQTIVLEDYLEMRPQHEPRLRRLIADGRILIGPWYDMPDEFLVSGEVARAQSRARPSPRAPFGTPMPVGYLPDLFGHVGQMPQILRNFGLDNAILWRGFGGPKAEYWWQAPDGSRVLMMHLPPQGYCNATRVHLKPELMIDRATRAIEAESARTATGEVLLMNGVDHVEPHPVIPELARQLSATLGTPVRHSTLPAYVDAVRAAVSNGSGASLDVIEGELRGGEEYANLLPGVFSARVYLKQANARVQTLLEQRAEPLATFAWMLGAPYPAEELRLRVEDAAAEPPARQHLRLQRRRRARGKHDAFRPCRAGRARGGRRRGVGDRPCGACRARRIVRARRNQYHRHAFSGVDRGDVRSAICGCRAAAPRPRGARRSGVRSGPRTPRSRRSRRTMAREPRRFRCSTEARSSRW